MAQPPGGAGSGSPDADPRGQSAAPSPELPTVTRSADPVIPPHLPTEVDSSHPATEVDPAHAPRQADAPHPPTEADWSHSPTETSGYGSGAAGAPAGGRAEPTAGRTVSVAGAAEVVRLGHGVPVSSPAGKAGPSAEQVWRAGRLPAPPRRRRRLRRTASSALTVILLAAAAVVLYLRFHHGPLQVTGVAITRQVTNGCAVNVTGRITTNGSAGTVSYQWQFQPQSGAPQPMSQSVTAGQDAVYVTVAVEGQSHASVAENVTLQVLGPGAGTASAHVVVSC